MSLNQPLKIMLNFSGTMSLLQLWLATLVQYKTINFSKLIPQNLKLWLRRTCTHNYISQNKHWSISKRQIKTTNTRKHLSTYHHAQLYLIWQIPLHTVGLKLQIVSSTIWWYNNAIVAQYSNHLWISREYILQEQHLQWTILQQDLSMPCQAKYHTVLFAI